MSMMTSQKVKYAGFVGGGFFIFVIIAVVITLAIVLTRKKKAHISVSSTPSPDINPKITDLVELAFAIMQSDVNTNRKSVVAYYSSSFKTAFSKSGLSIPSTPAPKWDTGTGRIGDIVMTLKDQAEAKFGPDGAVIAQAASWVYSLGH